MSKRPTGLIVVGLIVAALFANPQARGIAQDKTPDFSGLWTMTTPQVGFRVLIKQDATTISYGPAQGEPGVAMVIKLDGTESVNKPMFGTTVSTAVWKGNQLQITNHITGNGGETLEQVIVFFFDSNGQLATTVANNGQAPTTMIYKKQS